MKIYLISFSSLLIGILIGYICAGRIYFEKFLSSLKATFTFVVSRIDRMLIGNDGAYSHTRVINMVWGIGGFSLICIATMRKIEIPGVILVLMGSAMGISSTQAVINKVSELKFVAGQPNKPVGDGDKDDKSN